MASGLADYYRGFRPRYGGAYLTASNVKVNPNATSELTIIYGKGMVYGGVVWLDYTYTAANDVMHLLIDGRDINDLSFLRLKQYNIEKPRQFPVTNNMFDGTNFIYCVGISYGLTFETSLALYYEETYGRDPTVFFRLTYALI